MDILGFRQTTPPSSAPTDTLLAFEVKAQLSGGKYSGRLQTAIDAKLATIGPLSASDVLTWWTDTTGRAQFLALDEIPAGVAFLGTGIELYPQPGANFPDDVKVTMSLIPAGKKEAVTEKEVAPLVGDNMLRAEAMLPLANVPAGAYILRASVTVAGKSAGEASALINKK